MFELNLQKQGNKKTLCNSDNFLDIAEFIICQLPKYSLYPEHEQNKVFYNLMEKRKIELDEGVIITLTESLF